MLRQDASSGIGIVVGERVAHILNRQVVITKLLRVYQRFILLDVAASRVNFGDAWNRAQKRTHHPVLNGPSLDQLIFRQRTLPIVRRFQRVLIDLAKSIRDWPKYGR